jgi:hypothetical protein
MHLLEFIDIDLDSETFLAAVKILGYFYLIDRESCSEELATAFGN